MSDDSELQFEQAEFDAVVPTLDSCARCTKRLSGRYFLVDGAATCPDCRASLAAGNEGSGVARFARASLYGVLAAAVGAGIWYAIRETTGYEVGLISILIGFMVGGAVRAGSRQRGGWLYQLLAVFLAYSSIVSTYIPPIVAEFSKLAGADGEVAVAEAPEATSTHGQAAQSPADPAAESIPDPILDSTASAMAEPLPSTEQDPEGIDLTGIGTAGAIAIFAAFVIALAYAAPFLGGLESLLGLAIIGFGLWEAWRINRRVDPEVSGPFRLEANDQAPPGD
jgi:hypothetical protein